jgi:hypothetical protein
LKEYLHTLKILNNNIYKQRFKEYLYDIFLYKNQMLLPQR